MKVESVLNVIFSHHLPKSCQKNIPSCQNRRGHTRSNAVIEISRRPRLWLLYVVCLLAALRPVRTDEDSRYKRSWKCHDYDFHKTQFRLHIVLKALGPNFFRNESSRYLFVEVQFCAIYTANFTTNGTKNNSWSTFLESWCPFLSGYLIDMVSFAEHY